tara:strand:+ start:5988 stop:6179 length:192 start_codon:yes stop_codon:yes gene_type:complete
MCNTKKTGSYLATIVMMENEIKIGMLLLERMQEDLNALKTAMAADVPVDLVVDRWALLERKYK